MYYVLSRSKDITKDKEVEALNVYDNILEATNELHKKILKYVNKKILKNHLDITINRDHIYDLKYSDSIIGNFQEFEEILYIRIKNYDYFIDVYEDIESLGSDTETK
jgi:hypothetical protein